MSPRLNPDGSLDETFNPGASSYVSAIAVQPDGKILVVGNFYSIGGDSRNYVARLNSDGTIDSSFTPGYTNNTILTLALQTDGKILVGGYFTYLSGGNRTYIGRLNANGSLDTSFNPAITTSTGRRVQAILVQADGKIIISGYFNSLAGSTRNNIGRLHANGSLDTDFNPNAGNSVYSLALQTDGQIIITGSFTSIGSQSYNKICRLNTDGSVDASFNPGVSGGQYPDSLAIQPDGKIVVAGRYFTTLSGQARSSIGRLTSETIPYQQLTVPVDGSSVTWFRGGANPEIQWVTFDLSTNGENYTILGEGTRITNGWQLSSLSLPVGQNIFIRARGYYPSGKQNGSGSVLETISNIYLPNESPLADAGRDQFAYTSSLVNLDGSGSSDPDEHLPLTYAWAQIDGETVILSDPSIVNPSFTAPASVGELTFNLIVTDSMGLASTPDEVVITIFAQPPVAAFSGNPVEGFAPLDLQFTDESTGSPTGWSWYFGDEDF